MREKGEGLVTVELRGKLDADPTLKTGDTLRFRPVDKEVGYGMLVLIGYRGRARLAQAWTKDSDVHFSFQGRFVGAGSVKVLALVDKV